MRQFCFSPSSIGRRCFSEEQVWLNRRNRLNSTTHPACLPSFFFPSSLPPPFPWESLGDSVTFYRMHARVSFLLPELFSSGQQGRSRSTRSITGDPSDAGQVLLDYISSLGRSGHLRDACIQRKSAISPTSRGATGFHCKKSVLPIVLYYHAYSNNFLFYRFVVSRLSELLDVSNCI